MRDTYTDMIQHLGEKEIFVFGSNTEGRHGAGAALHARTNFGAIYGQALGLQGKSYAIITKDLTQTYQPSIEERYIIAQIQYLYYFASTGKYQDYLFYIAYSGTRKNLNGYTNLQMARMFVEASKLFNNKIPENIIFEAKFLELINLI